MNRIFISYSSSDKMFAQALEVRLANAGVDVFRDKSRLTVAQPYQDELFGALKYASVLVILWSTRVRDMKGAWKEWVITERERFRAFHPDGPIIYVLLDDEHPDVDMHAHKIELLRDFKKPEDVLDSIWGQIQKQIKDVAFSDRVQVSCYTLAVTRSEFEELSNEPNLKRVLHNLKLNFDQVASWYGDDRADWRPAGGETIREILSNLENPLTRVLSEEGVPERFQGCLQLTTLIETKGLWEVDDAKVKVEIDRLARLEFCWVVIDPLSLYHRSVQQVAMRIGVCADRNQWLSIFLIDPIGRILDRSSLRTKFENDFSNIYRRLVKPKLLDRLSCLGGVDLWHPDDFERVFRETIRLHRHGNTRQANEQVPERALAMLAPKQ